MSFLETLSRPTAKPVFGIIAGDIGMGKTSLAALFPKPIIIPIEDGTSALEEDSNVAIFPKPKDTNDVFDCITKLRKEDHPFKTAIFDSISAYDLMSVAEVQGRNDTSNLAKCEGGFGGGYHAVGRDHKDLVTAAMTLVEKKGMNVIFIAHTDTTQIDPPDSDSYTKYTIRITRSKQVDCATFYTDNADLVAFVKQKTFAKDNKAKSDGSRVISCQIHPAHVSKNRYGIEDDILFIKGENPFDGIIKQLSTPASEE